METLFTILVSVIFGIPILLVISQLIWLCIKGMFDLWLRLLGFNSDSLDNEPTWLEKHRERNCV